MKEFNKMQMIFTHFKALVSHPLVGMNVLASMEIACIYRASQADGFSLKFFSLLHNVWYLTCFSSRCFLVAASILSRASIMPLHSIDSNKFIPTKGCDTNTLKTREYHLHLIKFLHTSAQKPPLQKKLTPLVTIS